MALTRGAKGIVYFVHEFKPQFREDAIFRYPDIWRGWEHQSVDQVARTGAECSE